MTRGLDPGTRLACKLRLDLIEQVLIEGGLVFAGGAGSPWTISPM
ncbi:hypothetical protein [Croceicoccus naphthovorans]|nr:hypothetical protein [Croceicoccus naphthovorans]